MIFMTTRTDPTPASNMSRSRRAASALVVTLAVVGVAACGDASAPAAGLHMISNDGHRLAFYVTPGRAPAIVLDSGGGEDHTQWKDIVPQLSKATGSQIITYDRAGLGDSDEVKGPWDGRAAAADLQAGLRELGVTRDVVLAGHSQAGEVAHYFVLANPGVVSGAVLVDANLPPFFTETENRRLVALGAPQIEQLKKTPSTRANRQLIATADHFGPTHDAFHKVSWPDSVPAVYLVSERTPFDGSPQDVQRWRAAATAFVEAGPDRTLVTAEGSSHEIPTDRPALVLEQIERTAARVG
jgi:pimeloyl-ACP methyl ester carboxylesterase